MIITAVAFKELLQCAITDWSVCTQYIEGLLIVVSVRRFLACPQWYQQRRYFYWRGLLLFPQWFHTPTTSCAPRGRNPDTWGQVTWYTKPLWKQKTLLLELPSLLLPLWTCLESSKGHDNQWSDDVVHAYRPLVVHSSSSCDYHCCN